MPAEQQEMPGATRVLFGPFELNIAERTLKRAEDVIPLGARAFDILVALVDQPGEVVSKRELLGRVWPDVTVEEGSLRVHLSALRKALGDGQFTGKYIANVQGRGYSFVAPVTGRRDKGDWTSPLALGSNLPISPGEMVDRDDVVLHIRARFRMERLITITGPGGVGKTSVALAVGRVASEDFSGAIAFVDLSVLTSKEQVVTALASTLGLALPSRNPACVLLGSLRFRRALLILDNCEHLVEQVAQIADRISRYAPGIRLLATSREALQVAGESVFRLRPLDCPPGQPGQTAEEILSYPAARLFVERVSAQGVDIVFGANDADLVAEICRRLDGIPLAIELAARRAATFGIRDTAARLASLDALKLGRRATNPRHQTLRAVLDWSHDLLSDAERAVLRRAAIFTGRFTLEAAVAVTEHGEAGQFDVVEAIGGLVEKSLIVSQIASEGASYHLLDTTRNYALEKLIASGEHDSIATRHATYPTDKSPHQLG